jgi:hypothetical protein
MTGLSDCAIALSVASKIIANVADSFFMCFRSSGIAVSDYTNGAG